MTVFPASKIRTFYLLLLILVFCITIFSNARGHFEIYGFWLGTIFGLLFGSFLVFVGLGQRIIIDNEVVSYASNLFQLIFKLPGLRNMNIEDIEEVRLGIPRINKNMTTMAAINISSSNDEISFNPDLFENRTIVSLLRKLRDGNPQIKFDQYSTSLMLAGNDNHRLRTTVLKNFYVTVLLITLFLAILLFLKYIHFLDSQLIYLTMVQVFLLLPFIYNRIFENLRRRSAS